jgi:predicted ester cyclase
MLSGIVGGIVLDNQLEIVTLFLEAENSRDWEKWGKYLHPKVEYRLIGSQNVVEGKDNYIGHMKSIYSEIKDWRFQILNILKSGNIVMVELDGSGHFSGVYKNININNAFLKFKAVCIFEINEEKIHRVREYWDPVGYENQLNKYITD